MSNIDRRKFLILLAAAAPAVLMAHYLPTPYGKGLNGHDTTTRSLEWTPTIGYRPGDVIVISGFSNKQWNGSWRVVCSRGNDE